MLTRLRLAMHQTSGNVFSRQTLCPLFEEHLTGNAGGMAGLLCRCEASRSLAYPPWQQQSVLLAQDSRVILQ